MKELKNYIIKALRFISLMLLLFICMVTLYIINYMKENVDYSYSNDRIKQLNQKIIDKSKKAYVITHPKCDDTTCEVIIELNTIKYQSINTNPIEFNSYYKKLKINQKKITFKKELVYDIKLNTQIKYVNWDNKDYITEINHQKNSILKDLIITYPTLND